MSDKPPTPDDKRATSRPRLLAEPGTPVTSWVATGQYDRLCTVAAQRDESVSSLVRQMIDRGLRSVK